MTPEWTTSCIDWEDRIVKQQSLIPAPLFPEEAEYAISVMKQLRIVDVAGSPRIGECCAPWVFDFASAVFGAYDGNSGKRLIKEFFLQVPKKNSKALALNTLIPVPSGWKTMGELQVGDQVFGTNGKPCNVIAVSDIFTDHKCYELEFSNGEKVIADAGHQWFTSALTDWGYRPPRARTTQEIVDSLYVMRGEASNHSLFMPEPIECPDIELPVQPYTLGAWLGDGHSKAARITGMDFEIFDEIEKDGYPIGEHKPKAGNKAVTVGIGGRPNNICRRGHIKPAHRIGKKCPVCEKITQKRRYKKIPHEPWTEFCLAEKLRQAGVLNNKHIPDIYFRASKSQRLALLQGLMDTDGTISKAGTAISFTNTNERLARGVCDLLATLGIKHSIIERSKTCNGRAIDGVAYSVQFMSHIDVLPVFRLQRKLDRMRKTTDLIMKPRSRTVQIVAAREVPPVPVKCISVDAENKQFLFGKTMLPTHNSSIAASIMITAMIVNWRPSAEMIILAPTHEVALNAYKPARDMIKADEELDALFLVQDHIKTITHRRSGASLKVVAADQNTVGGKKASIVLIDEIHIFGKNANAENMFREATGGLAARPEGCIIYLTTQSDQPPAGVYKQKLQYARDVRDGIIDDKCFLPIIYEFPKKMLEAGQHKDPKNFHLVNPNMGYSVDEEFLVREFQKAEREGEVSMLGFMSKFLNVEIGLALRSDRWAGADYWVRNGIKTLTFDEILEKSEVISIGIDGGGLDDLLGLAIVGRDKEDPRIWYAWAHAWAHPSVLERRKEIAPRIQDFAKLGQLTLVEKIGDDVIAVADIVEQVWVSDLMDRIGVDPVGISAILDEIESREIPADKIVGVSQGWKMGGAIKTTERKLAEGTLKHPGYEMMAWVVGNARIENRANSILVTKQASGTAKIDPLMALFNAASLMGMNPEAKTQRFQMLVF